MNRGKQPEGTAVFIILLSLIVSVSVSLFVQVRSVQITEQANIELPVALPEGVEEELPTLVVGEQKRTWARKIDALVQINNKEVDKTNASYKFDACFLKERVCAISARGIRDEHKRTTFYFPSNYFASQESHAAFYVSLQDGGVPYLIMRLVYVGNDWITIKKTSILVDQDQSFERNFPNSQVQRKAVRGNLVYELGDIMMTHELEFVDAIANANVLAIRIEGESEAVDLERDIFANVVLEARDALAMYQLILSPIEEE